MPTIIPFSRKAKDKRGLESIQGGGSYTIRSRGKISHPNIPGAKLKRGSVVTVQNVPKAVKRPDVTIPGKTMTIQRMEPPKKTYIPGDFNPPGKPIADRPTTMSLGKSLREDPAKTQVRMQAQKEGRTSYDYKGRKEYAGRYETTPGRVVSETKTTPPKTIPGKVETIMKKQTTVEPPETPSRSSGKLGLRVRRVAGVNKQGQGQNYKRVDLVGKKGKVTPIVKVRTKTRRSDY